MCILARRLFEAWMPSVSYPSTVPWKGGCVAAAVFMTSLMRSKSSCSRYSFRASCLLAAMVVTS
eukprot:14515536-Heterocapsa_arctica.AAC.1